MGDRGTKEGKLDVFLAEYPDVVFLVSQHMSVMERAALACTSPLLRNRFRPRILVCGEARSGGSLVTYDLIGMNESSEPKFEEDAQLFDTNPTYRAFARLIGRQKIASPRSRRCGYDVLRHAPPPQLLLEWQNDAQLQVRGAPDSSDFAFTHSRHKRWVDPTLLCRCPVPDMPPRGEKHYWLRVDDPQTHPATVYEDFMWGSWKEVNLQEATDSPEPCDDCMEIPSLDIVLMRRHRKFWVSRPSQPNFVALLPDIFDIPQNSGHPVRERTSHPCFEYSESQGTLWVVGMPGQKLSSRSANNAHNIGHAHRTPLYSFPLKKYIQHLNDIYAQDNGSLAWLVVDYRTRLENACQWFRQALRGLPAVYVRHPHLIVNIEDTLHPIQRMAFFHLMTTVSNAHCLLKGDLRWTRSQCRVGFPLQQGYWARHATACVPSEDAMLIYTMPDKVKCRLVCMRTGQATHQINLPRGIGKGALLVPPLQVTG